MHELILYATPSGPLGDACATYFDAVEPTVAQTYPPHITLTGFFRRADPAVAVTAASTIGAAPPGAVEVTCLRCTSEWVGLEIASAWLDAAAAGFAEQVPAGEGEDAVRLKDWLHLSLAYGVPELDAHAARAQREIDPGAEVAWEVALWERLEGARWERLT